MINHILLDIIEAIKDARGTWPTKQCLQKTVYMIQKKGVDLGYDFRHYLFGVYCGRLDEDVQRLFLQGRIKIPLEDGEASKIIVSERAKCGELDEEIRGVIEELKEVGRRELELMTTIMYVSEICTDVTESVKRTKPKDEYNDEEIWECMSELRGMGYLK